MKKIYNILMLLAIALTGLSLTACSEDDLDTNQYKSGVSLNVYGPQPVMRGGYLRFLGSNLDQIAQIQIPGCDPITNYEVKKSGVPSEIWVQVPEEAEPGVVTLVTKTDQKITTQTALTFSEPIKITKFTPAEAMPGEQITIEGTYLELIQMVQFANANDEEVYVGQDDFVEHSRYKIVLTVPEKASTGKLNLYTLDLTNPDNDPNDMTYNILETDDALTVGTPTINKLKGREEVDAQGTITAKLGETITITGEHFGLVDAVTFGDKGEDGKGTVVEVALKDLKVSEDGKTISLTLPAEAPDGSINLVARSGVEIPVGQLETVAPTNCVAAPSPVKAGAALTITGKDLDVVSAVVFKDKDGNEIADNAFTCNEAGTQLVITKVPDTAVEGDVILRMANGKDTPVAFTLVKPTVTGYNSASVSAGGALTINGTDLDLVSSIDFGGAAVPSADFTSQSETSITLTVPMEAKSGAPTLSLKNGVTVEGPELTISEAVFCYATKLPSAEDEIKAGTSATLTVKNMDKLTGVEIDGETCKYVTSGDETLIVGVPETAGNGSKLRLISSNGEITYTVDFVPANEVAKVLYSGPSTLGWQDDIKFDASTFNGVPEGALLTINYTRENGAWVQMFLKTPAKDWPVVAPVTITCGENSKTIDGGQIVPTDVAGWNENTQEISVVLTSDNISTIVNDGGLILCGGGNNDGNCIINKVTLSYTISSEIDLGKAGNLVREDRTANASFPLVLSWSEGDGKIRLMSKTGNVWGDTGFSVASTAEDLTSKNWKAGSSVLCVYSSTAGQIQVNDPNWTDLYDGSINEGKTEIPLTQAMIDCLTGTTADGWSNTAFCIQGSGGSITKITIKP